jgi:hypothetical protein
MDHSQEGRYHHPALNARHMKKFFLYCLAAVSQVSLYAQFPQADISNGVVNARIYLPDAEKGYYRSTRFDWSGVMPQLDYHGHSYFGQWFSRYDPTINDAIMGPVESFWPLGYDRAGAGGTFVVIGVGKLSRPDTAAYSAFRYYPILNSGTWDVKKSRSGIEFRHRLTDSVCSYDYTKKITLTKGQPEMVIVHTLKNTGRETIETNVFNHNFFLLDSQSIGPGRVMKFTFPLTADEARGLGDLAAIAGDSITVLRLFKPKESVYAVLHGYDSSPGDYDIRLEDHTSGAAVRITSDRPLGRMVFWGSLKVLCPEPYIHISVPPGETFTWTFHYTFYTLNPTSTP